METDFFFEACGMPPTTDFTDECLGNITYCDTFFVRVLPPIEVAGLGPDILLCLGDPIDTTISLLMAPSGGAGAPYSINWILPDNSIVMGTDTFLNATMAGQYIVEVRDTSSTAYCRPYADTLFIIETIDQCCMLEVTCPDSVGGTFSCQSEIPDFDINSIIILDSCAMVSRSSMEASSGRGCIEDTLIVSRTYTFDDGTTSVDCRIDYKIVDSTPPSVLCPDDVTINCGDSTSVDSLGMPTITDACMGETSFTYMDMMTDGTCPDEMIITRTFTGVDSCGNEMMCDQRIMLQDMTMPTFDTAQPNDTTVTCAADVPPSLNIPATDDCGSTFSIGASEVTSDSTCLNKFTITRKWLVIDPCGNRDSLIQQITVNDNIKPSLLCPMDMTLDCPADTTVANTGMGVTMDNCPTGSTLSYTDIVTPGSCPQEFTVARTWLAVDACLNDTMCIQMITVQDTTPPSIVCPMDMTVDCGDPIDTMSLGMPMVSDACSDMVSITFSDQMMGGTCGNEMVINRTFTATDQCANMDTCVQQITIQDMTMPTFDGPARNDTMVSCIENVPASVTIGATDDCGSTFMIGSTQTITDSTCINKLIINRKWLVMDACGNRDSLEQEITVNDDVTPALVCPMNLTIDCPGDTTVANTGMAMVSDNCMGAVDLTYSDVVTPGNCPQEYIVARSWRAVDACLNDTTCVQMITIQDTIPPMFIDEVPNDTTVTCASDVPLSSMLNTTDACNGTMQVASTDLITEMTCIDKFIITRKWLARDLCGNIDSVQQIITVNDNVKPTLVCPINLTIDCPGDTTVANTGMASATDNCMGVVSLTYSDAVTPGDCPQEFVVMRSWMAVDACMNDTVCVQTIMVQDTTKPIIVCPIDVTINCGDPTDTMALGMPMVRDICSENVSITFMDM